ncbi:MAG TPA: M18 family aminopeptidase [Acidimicrobiales bacterium]|nr:M18 family aminopeptidase [Acidimicrobiales bacterium]
MTDRHVLGTPAGLDAARALMAFIDASPSPFHACASAAERLEAAGFRPLDEAAAWPSGPGAWYLRRGGSLVAWSVGPRHDATSGFRVVGAHTDSPNLRVKPRPDAGGHGFRQVAVEPYGGVLLNSWLDRDLGLSGRVTVRGADGPEERLLRVDEPLLRIPQLAIHLDREVTSKGLLLNAQQHLTPVWAAGSPQPGAFLTWVAARLGVPERDVLGWDLMLHDLTPSTLLGVDRSLLSAPRLDNLCSSWAGTEALAAVVDGGAEPAQIPVLVLFDHEEIGSSTDRGADSTLLPTVLERIVLAAGGGREELLRALAASVCCSADNAHATHPNYPDRHEPGHHIAVNGGPVLKVNSNVRYATDATSAAEFLLACERAGVPHQRYAHRADLPCGSTIGPITAARLGIPTFDVGVAQLAMHAARELCGADDPAHYAAAMAAFLAPEGP